MSNIHRQLTEPIDPLMIKWLLYQPRLHENDSTDDTLKKTLAGMLKGYKLNRRFTTKYKTFKNYGAYGRVGPYYNATKVRETYGGLATLKRSVRGFLADPWGVDVDFKKCFWYLIKWKINEKDISSAKIDYFLENYTKLVDWITENNLVLIDKDDRNKYDSKTDLAKKTIFNILHTSPSSLNGPKRRIIDTCKAYGALHAQIYETLLPLLKQEFAELVSIIEKNLNKNEYNKDGKVLGCILQHLEKLTSTSAVDFFEDKGLTVTTLIHDGFICMKDIKLTDELLVECSAHLGVVYPKLEMFLSFKPFLTGIFPSMPLSFGGDDEEKTPYAIMCDILLSNTEENKIRKDLDGNIYSPSAKNPLYYTRIYSHLPDSRTDFTYFLEDVFKENQLIDSTPAAFSNMENFLKHRNKQELLDIYFDKELIGFNNCVLDIKSIQLIPFEEIDPEDKRICRHFIDKPLDTANINTDIFDRVLMYQLEDQEALDWFYVFFGRMFFAPHSDRLDATFCIKGRSNTGKSLTGNVLTKCFRAGSITTINSNMEQVFGLENYLGKEAIIALDLPENMKDVIKLDLFKGMASGESVSVPRKNMKAKLVNQWDTPGLLISNYWLNYSNKDGALSKRYACFYFNRELQEIDTSLFDKIIEHELPSIIYRSVKAYSEFIKNNQTNQNFDRIKPQYFRDIEDIYNEETNVVFKFFNQESYSFMDKRFDIEFGEDFYTKWSVVDHKFKNWCKNNRIRDNVISSDDISLSKLKLFRKKVKMCKSCEKISVDNCCNDKNRSNRTTINVLYGVRFTETPEHSF